MTPMLAPALVAAAFAFSEGDTISFKPVEKGAMAKIGYYSPQKITMTKEKPSSITKVPDGLVAPMYGVLSIKSADNDKAAFHIILDEPPVKDGAAVPAKLYLDANGNGDLTDDPATDWNGKPSPAGEGKSLTMYNGNNTVQLGTKDAPFAAALGMYRFDPTDERRPQLKDAFLYYRDYMMEGEAKFGEKTYKVMLLDEGATGIFGAAPAMGDPGQPAPKTMIAIDRNNNGKIDRKGEVFDASAPFALDGMTYELGDIAKNGRSVKLKKSDKKVEEVSLAPDLSIGAKFPPFEAKNMDGKDVKFPSDYKGKIVMLDFWATWCGPCMMEIPGLVKTYNATHEKGFEVLGISLDKKDSAEKVKSVTGDKGMAWPQIYDGGFWQAALAKKYAIDSIPACFLVDGDTGLIIGDSSNLRGEKLLGTIESALEKKAKK